MSKRGLKTMLVIVSLFSLMTIAGGIEMQKELDIERIKNEHLTSRINELEESKDKYLKEAIELKAELNSYDKNKTK